MIVEVKSRNTIQRELILNAVRELKNHPTAEDVCAFVAAKHSHISKATVYNNLKFLAEQGEIQRIEVPNQSTRYDHVTDRHYHCRCRACGKLFDSEIPYDATLIQGLTQQDGFVVENFNLILNGVCSACINKKTKGE